jgi:hypothetical protein
VGKEASVIDQQPQPGGRVWALRRALVYHCWCSAGLQAGTFNSLVCGRLKAGTTSYEIALAMRKAAVAARPPIKVVCRPLRTGFTPVKRPLI